MDGDKSQLVRLLDVFVFGPLMLRAARDQQSEYFAHALTLIGLGTIVYNGVNYLQHRKADNARRLRSERPATAATLNDASAGSLFRFGERVAPSDPVGAFFKDD